MFVCSFVVFVLKDDRGEQFEVDLVSIFISFYFIDLSILQFIAKFRILSFIPILSPISDHTHAFKMAFQHLAKSPYETMTPCVWKAERFFFLEAILAKWCNRFWCMLQCVHAYFADRRGVFRYWINITRFLQYTISSKI